jgi:membrane-bound metal-dependent hydrolase YbcI (DUF457 family)
MKLLGHFALGFFSGVLVARLTGEVFSLPLILFCSLLPDLDFFARGWLIHRGLTHSVVVVCAGFFPMFVLGGFGLPYFAAIVTHLVGDYFNGGEQLLWPISRAWFIAPIRFQLNDRRLELVEVALFCAMLLFFFFGDVAFTI